jgi:hypothetical protein
MRLFVANIAFTTTEDELERLFAPYGSVDRVQVITDRDTGRSRGFCLCRDASCHTGPGGHCWPQRDIAGGTTTDGE